MKLTSVWRGWRKEEVNQCLVWLEEVNQCLAWLEKGSS